MTGLLEGVKGCNAALIELFDVFRSLQPSKTRPEQLIVEICAGASWSSFGCDVELDGNVRRYMRMRVIAFDIEIIDSVIVDTRRAAFE
jgi:hypothetical protein